MRRLQRIAHSQIPFKINALKPLVAAANDLLYPTRSERELGFMNMNADSNAGDKVLVATQPSELGGHAIYIPKKGVHEFFTDGIAGLIVNGSLIKLDLYSTDIIYDNEPNGFLDREHRMITHRAVMPIDNMLDFVAGFLETIDFKAMEGNNRNISHRLVRIALAATKKAQSDA